MTLNRRRMWSRGLRRGSRHRPSASEAAAASGNAGVYHTPASRRMTSVGVMAACACGGPPGATTYTRCTSCCVSSSSTCAPGARIA